MSEAKHTPGPWFLEGNWEDNGRDVGGWVSHFYPSGVPIFEMTPVVGSKAQAIANARLIAAAPELLEAAKSAPIPSKYGAGMSEYLRLCDDLNAWHERKRAAIAKAEGRE